MRAEWRVVFGLDDIFLLARTKTRASGARTNIKMKGDLNWITLYFFSTDSRQVFRI